MTWKGVPGASAGTAVNASAPPSSAKSTGFRNSGSHGDEINLLLNQKRTLAQRIEELT